MTPVLAVLLLILAAAVVWARGRLAVAKVRRVELEAFRVSLGLPADRFRVVDVGLVPAWRTRHTVPTFRTAHRVGQSAASSEREEVTRR